MANNCACRQCVKDMDPKGIKALDLFMRINFVCPICHDRSCPSAEDHRAACHKADIYAPETLSQAS